MISLSSIPPAKIPVIPRFHTPLKAGGEPTFYYAFRVSMNMLSTMLPPPVILPLVGLAKDKVLCQPTACWVNNY